MCCFTVNRYRDSSSAWAHDWVSVFGDPDVLAVHRSLPEYSPTPLRALPALARSLNLGTLHVKDESRRFGLNAFKALGAAYAVYRLIKRHCERNGRACPPAADFYRGESPLLPATFTFCTATDGNHGRGVAWIARKLRQRAVIFVPHGTVAARVDNIKAEAAEVIIVDGNYDCAVRTAAREAERHGWQIISDTSWSGYEDIPRWIMAGYTTLFREIHEPPMALPVPDIVIVQAGVGALAAAAAWYYNQPAIEPRPKLVSVEPTSAACLLESIQSSNGEPVQSQGKQDSIMAGLNCGTPSPVAWPLIKCGFDLFVSISDGWCTRAMRTCYRPAKADPGIIAGESGAAGLAALLAITEANSLAAVRAALALHENTRILILNTEGDTDPAGFSEIVARA